MLIRDQKHFFIGFMMTIVFLAILGAMFMPLFNGQNAFQASDELFNSISKASTNYFDAVHKTVDALDSKNANQKLELTASTSKDLLIMLNAIGAQASLAGGVLTVSGNLNTILKRVVSDSNAMFDNNGDQLKNAYGIPARNAAYAWWVYTNAASKAFKLEKRFTSAKVLDEVKTKAVEVGYNYYGVAPTPVSERIAITTFALSFYLVYTLWWGFSIFFMCEGLGLMMKKSSKQEA